MCYNKNTKEVIRMDMKKITAFALSMGLCFCAAGCSFLNGGETTIDDTMIYDQEVTPTGTAAYIRKLKFRRKSTF